ncbi:MAG: cytochrome c3 family protein [Acidobacteriota bacterium]|nr:hypothetical protein [Blastocatellia bacterium]MDW8412743.1 cytochrome c3 family protein [Acidobacteriota bacterium]
MNKKLLLTIGLVSVAAAAEVFSRPQTETNLIDYANKYDHFDDRKVNRKLTQSHKQLTESNRCDLCHSRRERPNEQDPNRRLGLPLEYPYHDACITCHVQQFTDVSFKICANCHEAKNYQKVKPFPSRPHKLTQFGMEFSHNSPVQHKQLDCNSCHAVGQKGLTQSVRADYPGHAQCYICHKPEIQPNSQQLNTPNNKLAPGGCIECHNLSPESQSYLARSTSQNGLAYDYFKFTHKDHVTHPSIDNRCEDCHNVAESSSSVADVSRIKIVLSKDPNKYHRSSCFTCHDRQGNWNITVRGKVVKSGSTLQTDCEKCHTPLTLDIDAFTAELKRKGRL